MYSILDGGWAVAPCMIWNAVKNQGAFCPFVYLACFVVKHSIGVVRGHSSLPTSSSIQNGAAVASLNSPPSNQNPTSKTTAPALQTAFAQ